MAGRFEASSRSVHTCWAAALLFIVCCLPGHAGAPAISPESLKAEVIYRLLMFITWPPERESPDQRLQLCTLAEGHVDSALQSLAGRNIRQLAIAVRRLGRPDQPGGCHVIYLAGPQPTLRAALGDSPVLVVSDAAPMLDEGAMINLQVEDGRIVFDVDLDAARRAGLSISTKLLRLARYVRHKQGALP